MLRYITAFWIALVASADGQVLFNSSGVSTPPPQAAAAGYNTLTLNSTFVPSTVDTANTLAPGFAWYVGNCCGGLPVPNPISFNADGTATINGSSGNFNVQIATATVLPPTFGTSGWVGTAYGGGAYFETVMKFVPAANSSQAFWLMAIEAMASLPDVQWPGQTAGYNNAVEIDIMEYCLPGCGGKLSSNSYVATIFNWYGIPGVTCTPGSCNVEGPLTGVTRFPPLGINWNFFHRVGLLWIPATASSQGSATWYVDDVMMTKQAWSQFTNQSPPPTTSTPWTFGVADRDHFVIIFGSPANTPMDVASVRVWQASAAGNLVQ